MLHFHFAYYMIMITFLNQIYRSLILAHKSCVLYTISSQICIFLVIWDIWVEFKKERKVVQLSSEFALIINISNRVT